LICDYSLYVLKTTSCGLPPGPFGLLGAGEGVSYLVVIGLLLIIIIIIIINNNYNYNNYYYNDKQTLIL
jgi:hypothetical protein